MKNLAILCISILLALTVSEIFLRQTKYKYLLDKTKMYQGAPENYLKADSEIGYDIRENVKEISYRIRWEGVKYEMWSNNLGCFDTPYKGDESYIILCGDSQTHHFCPYRDKYGTILEKSLDFRVLKTGVVGYGTFQELVRTKRIITKINIPPKLIVVGYYMNDLEDDYEFPNKTVVDGYMVRIRKITDSEDGTVSFYPDKLKQNMKKVVENYNEYGMAKIPPNPFSRKLAVFFNRNFIIYNLIDQIWERRSPQQHGYLGLSFYPVSKYPWLKKAWAEHLENLKGFKSLADVLGAKLLVLIIPRKEQVYPFLSKYAIDSKKNKALDLEYPNRILRRFLKKEKILYFDLLPVLRRYADLSPRKWLDAEKDLYWTTDGHLNIKGNRLLGFLLAGFLIEKQLIHIRNKEKKVEFIEDEITKICSRPTIEKKSGLCDNTTFMD